MSHLKPSHSVDHSKAPLYDSLCSYEKRGHTSLHVPGHKDGRVFDQEAQQHFSDILPIDATHVKGIDDWHHPRGSIEEAQKLAADLFGADHTFFLVGGSSSGNIATALSVCSPGDKIIVQSRTTSSGSASVTR